MHGDIATAVRHDTATAAAGVGNEGPSVPDGLRRGTGPLCTLPGAIPLTLLSLSASPCARGQEADGRSAKRCDADADADAVRVCRYGCDEGVSNRGGFCNPALGARTNMAPPYRPDALLYSDFSTAG